MRRGIDWERKGRGEKRRKDGRVLGGDEEGKERRGRLVWERSEENINKDIQMPTRIL